MIGVLLADDQALPASQVNGRPADDAQARSVRDHRGHDDLHHHPDELQRRRDTFGVSYVSVNGAFLEQLAPVVELLTGR